MGEGARQRRLTYALFVPSASGARQHRPLCVVCCVVWASLSVCRIDRLDFTHRNTIPDLNNSSSLHPTHSHRRAFRFHSIDRERARASKMDPPTQQPHHRRGLSNDPAATTDGPPEGGQLLAAAPSTAVFTDALTEAARPCHLYYVYEDDVRENVHVCAALASVSVSMCVWIGGWGHGDVVDSAPGGLGRLGVGWGWDARAYRTSVTHHPPAGSNRPHPPTIPTPNSQHHTKRRRCCPT